jgi:hypothetical protein
VAIQLRRVHGEDYLVGCFDHGSLHLSLLEADLQAA